MLACSARCTSAAPAYFEPYKHPATGRIYTDGAMERNNPVALADNERKFIWPEPSEHIRDIVLSIGTGYSTNFHGIIEQDAQLGTIIRALRKLGLISKIVILTSVLANTLNCQRMWHAFKNTLGSDLDLLRRCHRVNIPYGQGQVLCGLDEISKMKEMKTEALDVLSGKSKNVSPLVQEQLSDKLDLIARQLLASLFYLAVNTIQTEKQETKICHGWIRCRLSRTYQAQFQSLLAKSPSFRVIDSSGNKQDVSVDVRGWDKSNFSIPAHFRLPRTYSEVRVKLTLDHGRNWDDISGFPRLLHIRGESGNHRHSRVL
jgi:hypothetical protein